ncbi:hypothetical protein BC936DRAFT_147640 [Jimgerdemannia flammicorona]|uniref:Uncharacterized protein n=1 Tax=Jimgerdemannia flammicorona TaxID=994334 RepID=A0A433D4T8_9FUNG|nr:hypothetical protein BC936DRAFT_147640 [Jimgerdemannia flammicorona]
MSLFHMFIAHILLNNSLYM